MEKLEEVTKSDNENVNVAQPLYDKLKTEEEYLSVKPELKVDRKKRYSSGRKDEKSLEKSDNSSSRKHVPSSGQERTSRLTFDIITVGSKHKKRKEKRKKTNLSTPGDQSLWKM